MRRVLEFMRRLFRLDGKSDLVKQAAPSQPEQRTPKNRGLTLSDLEHAVSPLREELNEISRDLAAVRRGINQLLSQASLEKKSVGREEVRKSGRPEFAKSGVSKRAAAAGGPANVVETSAAASGAAATPAPCTEPEESLPDLILANFDRVDRESSRNHAAARAAFLTRLGNQVKRIDFVDNAVLFFSTEDTAYVHPWPNQRLGNTWLSFFRLSRGSNYPVLRLETLAVARQSEDGGWECLQKGSARNDD